MEESNLDNKPISEEISFLMKGIDETKIKIKEIERDIKIKIENNKIKFNIKHENPLRTNEDSFELKEFQYNYYFEKCINLKEVFDNLKILFKDNIENTFIIETNYVNLILFDNENQIPFNIKEIEKNQKQINEWMIENILKNKKENINKKIEVLIKILTIERKNFIKEINELYKIIFQNLDIYFQGNEFTFSSLYDDIESVYKNK